MLKGQASYPFSMIEAVFTFILILSVAYGGQTFTSDYFTEETIDIRADRVERAATVLESYPSGSIELDLTSYEFKVEGSSVHMRFDNTEDSRDLENLGYDSVDGPTEYDNFNDFCLEKTLQNNLVLGEC